MFLHFTLGVPTVFEEPGSQPERLLTMLFTKKQKTQDLDRSLFVSSVSIPMFCNRNNTPFDLIPYVELDTGLSTKDLKRSRVPWDVFPLRCHVCEQSGPRSLMEGVRRTRGFSSDFLRRDRS